MFNWNLPQAKVTQVITKLGFKVTVIDAGDKKSSAYAIWDSNSKSDLAQGGTKITENNKQIYIAATIKKAPAVGDYVQQGNEQWTVTEVEAYKPASTVLAYRVVVQ